MITVAFADNVHHVKNGSAVEILDEDAMVFALIFVYAVCVFYAIKIFRNSRFDFFGFHDLAKGAVSLPF